MIWRFVSPFLPAWATPPVLVAIVISISQSILMQLMPFYMMDTLNIAGESATQMVSVGLMAMAMAKKTWSAT